MEKRAANSDRRHSSAGADPEWTLLSHWHPSIQLRMSARDAGYVALPGQTEVDIPDSATSPSQPLLPKRPTDDITRPAAHGGNLIVHPDGSYAYSYGPKGLAGLRHNYYALLCAFFASIGGLEFGYDQGVIANVLVMEDFVKRWPITPLQKGTMTAVLELGALIGAICAGVFADRYSRRHSIIAACVVFCIGSAFQALAPHLSLLFLGRAVGGLGVGALSMLSPLYMAEISPPEVRGSLLALEQLSIVLGVVFGFWTGFLTRKIPGSASWRIPLAIQIVPGIILGLGCFILPPSPRWLVLQGRHSDALKSLAKLRMRSVDESETDPLLQIEMLEMRVETELINQTFGVDASKSGVLSELKAWGRLFSKEYRARTLVGVTIMFFQQWSGINALLYYGPTLIQSIGLKGENISLIVSGGIGIVQFLAVLPAIVYIDKLGRKPLLRFGGSIMTVSHFIIALLVIVFQDDWASHRIAAWMAVGGIYTFTAAYGVSFGPIGWVLPSEVFPLSMRSKGVALSTASNWANNFLIGLATPVFVHRSPSATFVVFSTACFLAYLWSTYSLPETANVSLEEMDEVFNSAVGKEDNQLKSQIEESLGLKALITELGQDP